LFVVIQYSCVDLYNGINGDKPFLNVDTDLYIILGVGIVLKLLLWIYCLRINASAALSSDTVAALAEDHFNDVLSNSAAIITASIAFNTIAWWVDPVGAILISLVIIYRWGEIIHEQVKKIVGHTAPPEFIQQVQSLFLLSVFVLVSGCFRWRNLL
jgi:divalent metal cation (Fe/Co/Zn/Cd) transporter